MPLEGNYAPNSEEWVRDHVWRYESSGGLDGTTDPRQGKPTIIVTSRGAKSGNLRKNPLMRVEHEGVYAAVASLGGAPNNPAWYHNIVAEPHVEVQDGPMKQDMLARRVEGEERAMWWDRAVVEWPDYAAYQEKTERVIPVFVLEPIND